MAASESEPSPLRPRESDTPATAGSGKKPAPANATEGLRRRISYFMFFRLMMLAAFTVLAGVTSWVGQELAASYEWATWSTLGVGFLVTLFFAWWLPHRQDLVSFAKWQTAIDLVLSAVVVQLTGGADSRFAFLYLIAILGAATMGDRRQIWVATSTALCIYGTTSLLQAIGIIVPMLPTGDVVVLPPLELVLTVARTAAAMVGIAVLSAYLNTQLLSSVSQLGSLRALNEDIVRSLSSGLVTVNMQGHVHFANPTARELLGLDDDPSGVDVNAVLPGVSQHLDNPGGPQHRFEIDLEQSDGRRLCLGLSCCPLRDSDGRQLGHVINFQDVTELRKLARLVSRNERLTVVGKLAATVAHEVRNPLAAIAGSAELLGDGELGTDDQRLLAVIRRESARLNATVGDLLAFTRSTPTRKRPQCLAALARDVAESFRTDPSNAHVQLTVDAPFESPVYVDPDQLAQVLWNLLRNAVDAMQGIGRLDLSVATDGEHVRLEVRDHGPGIDPDAMEHIFEPLYSTKDTGSGFGLAIVQRIVDEHDGTVSAENAHDGGAQFVIELPIHQVSRPLEIGPG